MKRTFVVISLIMVLLLLVGGVQAQRGGGVGWVRFGHASSDAEEVSILLNGDDWIQDMTYGIIYLYAPFEEGSYDIEFEVANNDYDEGSADFSFDVEEGKSYSVFVVGSVDDGTFTSSLITESDYSSADSDWEDYSQMIILNALDDEGFDVVDAGNGDEVWFEMREMAWVGWIFVNGTWDINITEPGDENDILLEDITGDTEFPAGDGFRYTYIITGTRRRPEVLTFISGYRTINEILERERDFSVMADAVASIDFDTSLSTEGNYTLFTPTDDAFDDAFDDVDEFLDDSDAVVDMLSYHLLLYYNTMAGLADEGSAETALDGEELEFDLDRDGWLEVNGVTVTRWIPALNGVIYEIDEVLEP
ncbi:MAG: fasciclin domain-containing protein [Anaerolineae bacterium]